MKESNMKIDTYANYEKTHTQKQHHLYPYTQCFIVHKSLKVLF